jgi:1,4-dihydroxy-2-naphthoate octaprenyltransferase
MSSLVNVYLLGELGVFLLMGWLSLFLSRYWQLITANALPAAGVPNLSIRYITKDSYQLL